jgi:hypothetical protein
MTIYLTNISNLPIKIEDLILTLQVLSLMYHGVQDVIQYDLDNIGDIYMYNIHDSLVETKKSFNTDDASVRETVMLTDMDSVNSFGFTDTNALHKQGKKVRSYYEDLLESTTKYPKFKALVDLYKFKFIQKYNNSVFKPYATYTDYIRANNKDLGTYLQAITDIVSDTDRKDEIERQIVYLTDAVKNALGDNTLVFDNDATDIMASYIREVVDVFKAYTVMLKDMKVSILVKDKTVYKLIDDYYFHAHMEWTDRIPDLSDAINPMHGKMDAYRKKGFMWRDYVRVNDSFTINHVDYS